MGKVNEKHSISADELRKTLRNRLNTQRRIIRLEEKQVVIIHPSFLHKIGVFEKSTKEVEKILFICREKNVDGESNLNIKDINQIEFNDSSDVKVICTNKKEYFLTSGNVYGKYEKLIAPKTQESSKSVFSFLTIEHKPSVASVVHSLNLKDEIDKVKEFSLNFIKKFHNKTNEPIKVGDLSKKGVIDSLVNTYKDLEKEEKDLVKDQYKKIFEPMELEIGSKYHNTSSIDFASLKYLIDNVDKKSYEHIKLKK